MAPWIMPFLDPGSESADPIGNRGARSYEIFR